MKAHAAVRCRTASMLAMAIALLCASGAPAWAVGNGSQPKRDAGSKGRAAQAAAPVAVAQADTSTAIVVTSEAADWNAQRLRRAASEYHTGNLLGVIAELEPIDLRSDSSFADADRAAFLLGQAYWNMGSIESFTSLARRVAGWGRSSLYTRWITQQAMLAESERTGGVTRDTSRAAAVGSGTPPLDSSLVRRPSQGSAAADQLAAALLIRDGDPNAALRVLGQSTGAGVRAPIAIYLEVMATRAAGGNDASLLAELAHADTATALGRDLAGIARIDLASRALAAGQDAREVLRGVAATSRYASRARHMLGVIAAEQGDLAASRALLDSLLDEDPDYAARRDVMLSLAGQAMDQGAWDQAQRYYASADRDIHAQRDTLRQMVERGAFGELWNAWQSNAQQTQALTLDALPAEALAAELATQSVDLGLRPAIEAPPLASPARGTVFPWAIAPPSPAENAEIAAAARALGESGYELERSRWALERERASLRARGAYLGIGLNRSREEQRLLAARALLLDSLRMQLDALDARLRAVRDSASVRLVQRARYVLDQCAKNTLWMNGMRHFHLTGAMRERLIPTPPGYTGADTLLAGEDALAEAIRGLAERMAAELPGLIARSYAQAWRPGLIDRAPLLAADAQRALAWARALEVSIDSSVATTATSAELRRLEVLAAALATRTDSLRLAHDAVRARVARAVTERAIAALEAEREGIEYGLASSAYALSVRLPVADSARAVTAPSERSTGGAAHAAFDDDSLSDPEATRWRGVAIDRMRAFLDQHRPSQARGEMRFRLADLLMVDAHLVFREKMARFVERQSQGGGGALPLVDHAPALALYKQILDEDLTFPHRDAVLFNAGMILADDGNAEAARFFNDLVTFHPESPYAQESYLRMGDLAFNNHDFTACIPLFEHAAAGRDSNLRVIALYKMGWAHFNQDRFPEAIDAFRSVLDMYALGDRRTLRADVEREAEAYLIHALARSGGAAAFAGYFDALGPRPYEMRMLMALGQHFRRFSMFEEATAADQLALARYPLTPEALVSAQRMIETYQRSNQASLAREAQLRLAPTFAPSSAWAHAQQADSLKAAGEAFAHQSWTAVAYHYHRVAREGGTLEDWRAARTMYETLLTRWPQDSTRASLEMNAGEASTQLGEYDAALKHYAAAAQDSPDSIATQAMWQRVAVTDTWYERSRTAGPATQGVVGSDSLARSVIRAADELMARYPAHPQTHDLIWRQANLAFAHGWTERAADDFGRMSARFPSDKRAPQAAALRADALFQGGQFEAAGAAYESAVLAARAAGNDSLERRVARAIPISYHRQAEAAVAADSNAYARHAELFEKLAARYPGYEHAHAMQYRAGLAYLKSGQTREAVLSLQALIQNFPSSEFVRDAHVEIARAWEESKEPVKAAEAYARFAERFPKDSSAADAWLKAADLYAAGGMGERAEGMRLTYLRTYPDDTETAMEILEPLARRDLKSVGPGRSLASLLPAPAPEKKVAAQGKNAPQPASGGAARTSVASKQTNAVIIASAKSHLAAYLALAEKHPTLASKGLVAEVQFTRSEEANAAYRAARLTQPLKVSIPAKRKLMDSAIAQYRACVDLGIAEWAHASAFRMGESLLGFGESLERSERPADLRGDDLVAYENVLHQEAQTFYDRGEAVWSDLLKQTRDTAGQDAWVTKTQSALWGRLGSRFYYRPEVEFPLVAAVAPEREEAAADDQKQPDKKASKASRASAKGARAQQPGAKQR